MTQTKIIFMIFSALILQGCNSCNHFFAKTLPEPEEEAKKEAKFSLSPQRLDSFGPYFYHSRLNITLSNGESQQTNSEIIAIRGTPTRFYVTKKIDESHFFEIISDHSTFFVKSSTGDWRSGDSNKAYYRALVLDACNVLEWIIEQAGIETLLNKKGNFLEIINQPLPSASPLVALLKKAPTESLINGRIEINQENIPCSASVHITLSSGPEFQLNLELDMSIKKDSNVIVPKMPELAEGETLTYPVNIATRFKSLMDSYVQQ